MTILKLVWSSRRVDAPGCAHFPTDICSLIQEGVITVEKCASAHRERHTLSLGRNKHGHNSTPFNLMFLGGTVPYGTLLGEGFIFLVV